MMMTARRLFTISPTSEALLVHVKLNIGDHLAGAGTERKEPEIEAKGGQPMLGERGTVLVVPGAEGGGGGIGHVRDSSIMINRKQIRYGSTTSILCIVSICTKS